MGWSGPGYFEEVGNMEGKQDIWIWMEHADGACTGLELVTPGRKLAQRLGGSLTAVAISRSVDELLGAAVGSGVDKIVAIAWPTGW